MESDQVHRTNRQHLVRPDLFRTRLFRNPPGREEVNEPSRAPLTLSRLRHQLLRGEAFLVRRLPLLSFSKVNAQE